MAAKKAKRAAYWIEIVESLADASTGDWYWRVKHRNKQTILVSETYSTIAKARQSAQRFAAATGLEVREAK